MASSKWVHISSFSEFSIFEYFIDCAQKAKFINPNLKVSLDLGYEYTKIHKVKLVNVFSIADYIFLNKNELDNLAANADVKQQNRIDNLAALCNYEKASNTQVIIIKGKDKHEIISFFDGVSYTRTFWYKRLLRIQIHNDTGAGDVFAGGFIAGILTPCLLTHQPAPIQLGAIVASERLKSKGFPEDTMRLAAHEFIIKSQLNERKNNFQRIKIYIESYIEAFISLIIGIIAGVIGTILVNVFSK